MNKKQIHKKTRKMCMKDLIYARSVQKKVFISKWVN